MLRVADYFADSDTGRARRANEDAFYAHAPVFAVADGMGGAQAAPSRPVRSDATALHSAAEGLGPGRIEETEALLRVEQAPGLESGSAFDLVGGAVLGRGDAVDIHLEDPFASTNHARISWEGSTVMIEDLGSTNGTYLNGEPLDGPAPLHVGDRIRIGDSEFSLAT